ncbi:Cadherin-16 [Frankliniella fusca]|uniref:Cadherin-16 n=1 Tax=Frankliniella fusca TaxID=407009 RepID=A0AAE1HZG8_9NEOP|nr:Cadherin-16 [Frankliniella fusca]
MPPPPKRLKSSGHTRPPAEQGDDDGDGVTSSDEAVLEIANDSEPESDFSDAELDVSYQPHTFPRCDNSASSSNAPSASDSTSVTSVSFAPNILPSKAVSQLSSSSSINEAAGNFVLSAHEKGFLSVSERKELLDDAKLLVKECIKKYSGKVDTVLQSKGSKVKMSDIVNVEKFASSTCYDSFKNLETETQQQRFFKDTLGVTDVKRIPLGKVLIRGRKGTVTKTKVIDQELIYVPLEETVEKMINHPDYKVFVENTSSGTTNSKQLDCYMKGSLSKDNNILREHPDALRFILYYDDVEVLSPLKSRSGKQKVGAFYIFLDNIPLKYRSCLKVICLLALVNANLIKGKYYGMDAALEVIVTVLQLKSGQKVYGTLIAVIGDNLGQHSIAGFKEGFTAKRCCRICMARFESEIKTMTREDPALLRTIEDYRCSHRGAHHDPSRSITTDHSSYYAFIVL